MGRIRASVAEIKVERYQNSVFAAADFEELTVRRAAEAFVVDCFCLMTPGSEKPSGLRRKVLVNLEFHAPIPSGSAKTRSLARSAA